MIEEYAYQAACLAVKDLLAFFGANPDVFAKETVVLTLEPGARFTRPAIAEKRDPFVTFATLDYKHSKARSCHC